MREAQRRLRSGLEIGETQFLTLTMPADADPETSFRRVTPNFKLLRQRHERAFGRAAWAWVIEEQLRGVAHLHALLRGSGVSRSWLAVAATDSGFGRQVDARPAAPSHVEYMTKSLHLASTIGLPSYVRRVHFSRNWASAQSPERLADSNEWWIANAPPLQTADFLRGNGYSVSDVVSGVPSGRPPSLPIRWWPAGAARFTSPFPVRVSRVA